MYLVAIAWLYVALMMAVVEATSTQGSVLGAIFTFLLYGLGPVALTLYLLGTPGRRAARRRAEAAALEQGAGQQAQAGDASDMPSAPTQPDGGGHAPREPVTTERKEP